MNDFATAKNAFNDYRHAVEEFKTTNEQKLAEVSKNADLLTSNKLAAIGEAVSDMQGNLERLTKQAQRPQLTAVTADKTGQNFLNEKLHKNELNYKEYCLAFGNYLRWAADKHGEGLHEDYRKALNFGANSNGAYWFPDAMTHAIDDAIRELSPLRKHCPSVRISGEYFSYPLQLTSNAKWLNPVTPEVREEAFVLRETKIEAHEHFTAPRLAQSALTDTQFNVEEWLVRGIAEGFANSEHEAFLTGNNQDAPQGLLKTPIANTPGEKKRTSKFVEAITSSITDDVDTTIQTLYKLVYAMPSSDRKNSVWLMNRRTATKFRQLKDSNNNYLWAPSNSSVNNFLGYQVLETDQVSDLNQNEVSLVFVNLQRSYLIVDHSMSMLRDPYTHKPWVVFYVNRKVGGGVVNAAAIKFLKTPTLASV